MSIALENMSPYARSVVERLGLEAHPEGGWYVRDWQAPATDTTSGRPLASLIYFLLPEGDASAWHKVDADEIWLWHGPATVTLELGGSGDQPAADPADRTTIVLGDGIAYASKPAVCNAAVQADMPIVNATTGIAAAVHDDTSACHTGNSTAYIDGTDPATVRNDSSDANRTTTTVGHAIVPAGVWQRTVPGHGDALVSCVVSPGFTFDGFILQ